MGVLPDDLARCRGGIPIKSAWRDVRDVATARDWTWPAYETVLARFNALPPSERLYLRHGREEAARRLSIQAGRDKTTIAPLEWVSLDGRKLDFWVDFGDGKAVRPIMLALVDVASNKVIGYELAASENAVATSRLIRATVQKYGIFKRIYTDNGSAFAGHLMAGGNVHKWRGKRGADQGVKPPGVCSLLGIAMHFALPRNGQAKIAERFFANASRQIDDRPDFKGGHVGHKPGEAPPAGVVPVPIEVASRVIEREIARHNLEQGRRADGAKGRSYAEVFEDGLKRRIKKPAPAHQLYLASLIYKPVSVDRNGQVKVDGWVYGGPKTQDDLLRWHGKGQILVGRDPDDFTAPAIAYDADGHLICVDIQPMQAGEYGSVDGARVAARNRKAARAVVAKSAQADKFLSDQAFADALEAIPTPVDAMPGPEPVVSGRFGSPLRKAKPIPAASTEAVPEEYRRNFDAQIAALKARGEKIA